VSYMKSYSDDRYSQRKDVRLAKPTRLVTGIN